MAVFDYALKLYLSTRYGEIKVGSCLIDQAFYGLVSYAKSHCQLTRILSVILYTICGPYVFSLPISLVMTEKIHTLCLLIIIKSQVWTIAHCLGLGHETLVSTVCLSIFLGAGKFFKLRGTLELVHWKMIYNCMWNEYQRWLKYCYLICRLACVVQWLIVSLSKHIHLCCHAVLTHGESGVYHTQTQQPRTSEWPVSLLSRIQGKNV